MMLNILRRHWATTRNSQIVQNAGWNMLGSLSVTLLAPIVSIIAARLLNPGDYGSFGVAAAVLAFLQIGRDFGLTQAVIVSEKNDDFRNLQFTVQIFWSGLLLLLLIAGAPLIAAFYHVPELVYVLPLLAVTLLLSAITDPMHAANLKAQNYRFLFFRQIVPAVVRGTILIAMAYEGAGVYALVAATLMGAAADAVFMFWHAAWKPRLHFDGKQFREFFRLGKHQVIQEFCGFLVLKADALIVGRNLGIPTLGIYQMGNNLANILPNTITPQIAQVVFTDLAKCKGDVGYLKRRYYQFIYLAGMAALASSVVLYFAAKPLVPLLLGAKWKESAIVMQAFSLLIPFVPLSLLNVPISKIYGFNHVYSYFAVGRGAVTAGLVLAASFHSLQMVLLAWVVSGMLGNAVNSLFFFKSQTMVRTTPKFVALFAVCCMWAGFGLAGIAIS